MERARLSPARSGSSPLWSGGRPPQTPRRSQPGRGSSSVLAQTASALDLSVREGDGSTIRTGTLGNARARRPWSVQRDQRPPPEPALSSQSSRINSSPGLLQSGSERRLPRVASNEQTLIGNQPRETCGQARPCIVRREVLPSYVERGAIYIRDCGSARSSRSHPRRSERLRPRQSFDTLTSRVRRRRRRSGR